MTIDRHGTFVLLVAVVTTVSSSSAAGRSVGTRPAVSLPREFAIESRDSIRSPHAEQPAPTDARVRVRNIRLEASPPVGDSVSATLKFDVHNDGSKNLIHMVLSVSLLDAPHRGAPAALPLVLVGPFKVRASHVLPPGYSVHYEIRLRNVSSDCNCVPTVDVLEAGFAAEEGSEH